MKMKMEMKIQIKIIIISLGHVNSFDGIRCASFRGSAIMHNKGELILY